MQQQASNSRSVTCLLLLCLSAVHAVPQQHDSPGRRRLLIRPLPSGGGTCKNTYQGPHLMADDKGKVCATKELDFFTGCCKEGQLHACDKCGKDDSCCESFEHCVSCCLAPDNQPEAKRQSYPRVPHSTESKAVWDTPFEYCMAVCRTHVFSTSHENAYIGPRHHCFSKLGKPLLSPPLPAGTLDGVTLVLSAAGSSCASMCEQQGTSCSQSHLHHINSCDRLREVNNCEAGCVEEEHADYLPAAVDPEAPKANRPALCLASSKGTAAAAAEAFTCAATENHMRRLCPCVKGADGGSSSSKGSSSSVASKGSSSSTEAGGAAAAAGQQDTVAKEGAQKPSSSSSSSNSSTDAATETDAATTAAAAATQPGADKGQQQQQQQQQELPGPDELGATNEEGNGGDASTDGAADGEGDMREYEEDPDRGE